MATDIVNELVSVEDFIVANFPTANTEKQTVPKKPTPNLFVVRFQDARTETELRFSTVTETDWQLVYFGSSEQDVLTQMNKLRRASLNNRIVIPIANSLRYMRVGSFSFGQPFKTDTDVDAVTAVLTTETREARDQATYQKIMQVNTRYK